MSAPHTRTGTTRVGPMADASLGDRPGRGGRANIRDVARVAEVSVATVSRVLSDSSLVREATREKVLRAAESLGYLPNAHARALVGGGGHTVAFLSAEMVGPSFADLASGVEQVTAEYGHLFMLCTTHNDVEREQR